jgi:HlyD family secretion protein
MSFLWTAGPGRRAQGPRAWTRRLAGPSRTAVVALTALLVLAGCSRGPDERFASEKVSQADVVERVSAPGSVQAADQQDLTAPAAGTIKQLLVRDGARVRRGQLVARLASPSVDDAVRQAEAAAGAASSLGQSVPGLPTGQALSAFDDVQAQVGATSASVLAALRSALPLLPTPQRAQAAKSIDRAARRIARSQRAARRAARAAASAANATTASLTSALSSAAAAQRAQADIALDIARDQRKRLDLRAPIAGTVQLGRAGSGGGDSASIPSLPGLPPGADQALSGLVGGSGGPAGSGPPLRTGSQVGSGQTVATILDIDHLSVSAEVDETDIALVKTAQRAQVELDAFPDVTFDARVTGVALTPSSTRTSSSGGVSYQVDLVLGRVVDGDGAPPAPRVGMTATADIKVREAADALSVASSALVGRGSGQAVYVIEDGHVRLRPIRLAASGEDRIAVASGLKAGERVVIRGAERLRDGQSYPGA